MTGQPFVVNNITGLTGYEMIHQGTTDGYDFIMGTTTIFTSELDGTLDYDWNDYEMVAFIEGDFNTVIAVQADSPYQTINDLLDAAKNDPSSVTGGITLSGQPYMFSKALADAVGIDLYYVDCGTTAERNTALLGGQVTSSLLTCFLLRHMWILVISGLSPLMETRGLNWLPMCPPSKSRAWISLLRHSPW